MRTWVGLAISALCVAAILWRVPAAQIGRDLRAVSPGWFALALLLKLAVVVVKGLRWGVVVRAAEGGWPRDIVSATMIGTFGNMALPARLGEIARVETCKRRNPQLDRPRLYATVVLERVLDLVVVLGLFATVVLVQPLAGWAASLRVPLTALAVLGIAVSAGLLAGSGPLRRMLVRAAPAGTWRATLAGIAERASGGLALMRSATQTALALTLTVAAWLIEIAGTAVAFVAFGISAPWSAAALVSTVVALGVAIPSAPAGIGTAQALYVACLGLFGVAADRAISVSVGMAAGLVVGLGVIAIGCLWAHGTPLRVLAPKAGASIAG